MSDDPTETEPFSPAYLNVADLLRGIGGIEVRLRWILRYAPDHLIRRYVQDALDRFEADFAPPDALSGPRSDDGY